MSTQAKALRARRRPGEIAWKEPRRSGGPELTATQVAKMLDLSTERVKDLAIFGPERDGLPGYINVGNGWERKHGSGYPGVQIMFYKKDVDDWGDRHQVIQKEYEPPVYSEAEKRIVLQEAELIRDSNGAVNRQELFNRLRYIPGTVRKHEGVKRLKGEPRTDQGYGPDVWHERTRDVMTAILNDANIPPAKSGRPKMVKPSSTK